MKDVKLFESFSYVDLDLIARCEKRRKNRVGSRVGAVALAAGAAIIVGLAAFSVGRTATIVREPDGTAGPSVSTPPTAPIGPTVEPTDETDGTASPREEEPPALIFNDVKNAAALAPPKWYFELVSTPMSAYQLELAWSADCPTAFLEEGEAERWYYGNNVSGVAQYFPDGGLYCLRLVFREDDNHIPALVTVSPVDGPLFTGCAVPENREELEPSQMFECYAYRYDFGDRYVVAAEFTIGADRYRVSANATPEELEAAERIVYDATVRFWQNFIKGVCPDLSSFRVGDSASGRLAGEDGRKLLKLEDNRELDDSDDSWDVIVYRDGAVERGYFVDDGTGMFIVRRRSELTRPELMELYDVLGEHETGAGDRAYDDDSQFVLIPYDPWGQSREPIAGRPEDDAAMARVWEILGVK